MVTYVSFYAAAFTLTALAAPMRRAISFAGVLLYGLLVLFAGMRGHVGADTPNYLLYYQLTETAEGIGVALLSVEPLFVLFLAVHKLFINSPFLYLLTLSVIQCALLYQVSKESAHRRMFLTLYIGLFYLNFHFNTVRIGLASLLLLYAVIAPRRGWGTIAAVLAPGFHVSILLFYPLLLPKYGIRYWIALAVLIASVMAVYSNWTYSFFQKFLGYQDYLAAQGGGLSLFSYAMCIYSLVPHFVLQRTTGAFKIATALFIAAYGLQVFYPAAYRLVIMATLFYFSLFIQNLPARPRFFSQILLWIPLIILFGMNTHLIYTEREKLEAKDRIAEVGGNVWGATYIPYKLYWHDDETQVWH